MNCLIIHMAWTGIPRFAQNDIQNILLAVKYLITIESMFGRGDQ